VTASLPVEAAPRLRVEFGGFGRRFTAWMIDMLFLAFLAGSLQTSIVEPALRISPESDDQIGALFVWVIVMLLSFPYYTLLESSRAEATVGKGLLGLRVLDLEGRRISLARANTRFWAKALSNLSLGVGYLAIITNPMRQAWHDSLAKTVVARREKDTHEHAHR